MLSNRLINLRTIKAASLVSRRCLAVPAKSHDNHHGLSEKQLMDFDPNNYSIPLRPITMDDIMEPYGSWKIAYEAERKTANKTLIKGIVAITIALTIFYQSGVIDTVMLPNLDNIMEDTEPFDFDKEGRKTV